MFKRKKKTKKRNLTPVAMLLDGNATDRYRLPPYTESLVRDLSERAIQKVVHNG